MFLAFIEMIARGPGTVALAGRYATGPFNAFTLRCARGGADEPLAAAREVSLFFVRADSLRD